jgi:predicted AlkP superfamily phosphohydrolase/phosphomutase
MAYPVDEIDGFMITGLMTPDYNSQRAIYPRDLLKKYRVNTSLLSRYVHSKTANRRYKKFLRIISKQLKEKGRLALELVEKEEWDFFMVHFFEIDTVSHCMWRFMDKNSPLFSIKGHKNYGDAILKIYQQCDKIIGDILEKINGKNLNVILMSDHGFGQTLVRLNINNWLRDIGLLKFKDLTLDKIISNLCNRISLKFSSITEITLTLNTFMGSIYKLLPKLLRYILDFFVTKAVSGLPSALKESILPFYISMIDWCNTKAYSLGTRGGIFINLEGQNNFGIVKKEEYEPLLSYILEEMRKVRSPEGSLIIKKAYKKHEVFHGKYLDRAPDLIPSEECDGFHFSYDFSERGFILDTLLNVNGSHRTDGILIISGEDVKRGKEIINAKIEDLTPTIYYLMGVPIPKNLDGRILGEYLINSIDSRIAVFK